MIAVRLLIEEDRPALRQLFLTARREAFDWLKAEDFALSDFDDQTAGEELLVAANGSELLGFASVWLPDKFVHHLYVHPAYQRTGIGKLLLITCLNRYGKPLTLKCLKQNMKALKFYIAQGWQSVADEGDGHNEYLVLELR